MRAHVADLLAQLKHLGWERGPADIEPDFCWIVERGIVLALSTLARCVGSVEGPRRSCSPSVIGHRCEQYAACDS